MPGAVCQHRFAHSFTSSGMPCQMLVGRDIFLALPFAMNRPRFSPSPPVSSPSRALSGWRARLASDPIPRLLREGSPSVLARIRRDLIDDSEAPGLDEVWAYPEVKALVKKMREERQLRAQGAGQGAGRRRSSPRRWPPCARSIGWPIWACALSEGATAPARAEEERRLPARRRRRPTAASPIWRWPRRPRGGPRWWPCTSRAGPCRRCAGSASRTTPRVEKGLQFLLERRQDDGGWAWRGRAHRFGGAALQPPGHRHGAAGLRLVDGAPRPRARPGARPSCWPRASCSPIATPTARRPASGRC